MSRPRRRNFNFFDVGIEHGAVLEPDFRDDRNQRVTVFWKHEKEKVTVASPKEVLCDGTRISFSELTGLLLDKIGRRPLTGFQSSRYWRYNGKKLDKIYNDAHAVREAQQS